MKRLAPSLLAIALIASTALADGGPAVPGSDTMDRMLDRVAVMQGREYKTVTIFPIVLKEEEAGKPLLLETLAQAADRGRVTVHESTRPSRPYDVVFVSSAPRPVLVLAGTVLHGGKLDRMIAEDLVLAPGRTVEVSTIPAEYPRDLRKGKKAQTSLGVSARIAPVSLRRQALIDDDRNLVARFVSHFLGFRQVGDTRRSLLAVSESPALERQIRAYMDAFANFPGLYERRVVGWVTVVGGRVHSLELFGSNDLAAAHFPALLRAHAFPTTALEIQADKLGIRLPEPGAADDPERFRPMVDRFLEAVRKSERRCGSKPEGTLGSACQLRRGKARGEVLVLDDRLIHAGAIADLPFHERLYDRPLPPPPGELPPPSFATLERADGADIPGRRLTDYERRLLERMRARR
jgi:hypothetical protein